MTQPALKGVTSPHRDYVTVDGAWMQIGMFEFKFEWSKCAEPMYQELAWFGLKEYKAGTVWDWFEFGGIGWLLSVTCLLWDFNLGSLKES